MLKEYLISRKMITVNVMGKAFFAWFLGPLSGLRQSRRTDWLGGGLLDIRYNVIPQCRKVLTGDL